MTTTSKGGRPSVGPRVNVALPADMIGWVDLFARQEHTTRAAMLRRLIGEAVWQRRLVGAQETARQ